jgi:formylglycine-generating enzyme required for sulfatase activity
VATAGKIAATLVLGATAFALTYAAAQCAKAPAPAPAGMVWIPGGEFTTGADAPYAPIAEKPAYRVRVDGFWMDETDVTNAQFRAFAEATGYVTKAERTPTLEEIMSQAPRGTPPPKKEDLVPGSVVLAPPRARKGLRGQIPADVQGLPPTAEGCEFQPG